MSRVLELASELVRELEKEGHDLRFINDKGEVAFRTSFEVNMSRHYPGEICVENILNKWKVRGPIVNKVTNWNADFLDELSDDAFRGLTKLFSTNNSEAGQEELVTSYLDTHWERLGIEPTFEQVCDVTEVHQDIVRKVYDRFMSEWKLEEVASL